MVFMLRQRMKDLLLWTCVVFRTSNMKFSRCRLAGKQRQKNCTKMRAARAARSLFFRIQSMKWLIWSDAISIVLRDLKQATFSVKLGKEETRSEDFACQDSGLLQIFKLIALPGLEINEKFQSQFCDRLPKFSRNPATFSRRVSIRRIFARLFALHFPVSEPCLLVEKNLKI